MKNIRKGVFETNSSSTHSICVAKDMDIIIPTHLHLQFGEFGWEYDRLDCTVGKASYLYTGIQYLGDKTVMERYWNNLVQTLESKGVEVTREDPIYRESTYGDTTYTYVDNGGYVDHGGELREFIEDVMSNEDKLLNYLFSPMSFILTGNDNNDHDVDIDVDYDHDVYYKDN